MVAEDCIESGDILGKLFNITTNFTNEQEMIKGYIFIENKFMRFIVNLWRN